MRIRPCIDIHNGRVKQIVGSSLRDREDRQEGTAQENFVSDAKASYYAQIYREMGLKGGHIILLNSVKEEAYQEDLAQAKGALRAFPGGMQIGGGITPDTAGSFIDAGASHVIVTSFVFRDGKLDPDALKAMTRCVGRERLVLDLSCRRTSDGKYKVVTDRWQKFTEMEVSRETLRRLEPWCSEFLIHAADVEGKASGVERDLVRILAEHARIPVTYAGGVGSYEDLRWLADTGNGRIHVTVGSALDLFGGPLEFRKVIGFCKKA